MNKIAILCSGGDVSGMNPAIKHFVEYSIENGLTPYFIYDGFEGLIDNKIYQADYKDVTGIINRGGTKIRSARSERFKDPLFRAQAQANLDRLLDTPTEDQLAIAQQQVRQSEIALEQAKLAQEGAQLVAPFSGTVAQVNIKLDEMVSPGQPAVVLVDLSEFYVDVGVDELDVIYLEEGQEVILTLDALQEKTIAGRVERVDPVATVASGVVSYVVRVTIDEPDPRLRAGMTASVDVITARHVDVLTVPNRAIKVDRQTGRTYVEKLVDQKPVETDVELGLRSDQVSEIVSGLEDGDEVIIRGVSSLERLQQSFGGGPPGF